MKNKAKKNRIAEVKTKHKLSDMSVDDFMETIGEESSANDDSDSGEVLRNGKSNGNGLTTQREDNDESGQDTDESEEDDEVEAEEDLDDDDDDELNPDDDSDDDDELNPDDDSDDDADEDEDGAKGKGAGKKHKQALEKLKDTDPEFYKYLQENDKKLLQFNLSDSEESEDEADDTQVHDLPSKLEVDSDESDYEPDGPSNDTGRQFGRTVTLKMVKAWREQLISDKTVQTISDVVQAFHAAMQRISQGSEKDACMFKVDGSAVFNAVVQMCVLDLLPAFRNYLKLPPGTLSRAEPHKCKRWSKVKTLIKSYVVDLLQLLSGVASVNISTILLKHIHQMSPFIVQFSNVTKNFLKKLISFWGTGDETVRVVAFMCILRITTSQQKTLLDQTLRVMYMTYIQNTKFVSPNTLPGINFMRRSLSEMFLLDENVSYHHAFLYIRQLAIHLRNAITLKNKESIQSVYNWQYVASLALWVELLSAANKPVLQPLLYPVVQVITGAIKLVPTAQYYPLRFHCTRLLINISRDTGTFVPVLPFLLEVLNSFDFNKKHSKVTMKPLDFSCILRVSKTQQQENGFKDAVIDSIYNTMFEYLATESSSIAFPDLTIPVILQLKSFLKVCKVANYTKKVRQILDKIEENSKFVVNERKSVSFNLSNRKAIEAWETSLKVKGTPLAAFFNSWKKLTVAKQAKMKSDRIDISEDFPTIIRRKKTTKSDHEGPVELLPSDDSDSDINFGVDSDGEDEEVPVKKRSKKPQSKVAKKVKVSKKLDVEEDDGDDAYEAEDIVEDISQW